MIFTVLRVQGSDFAVDTFLNGRRLDVSAVWHKGQPSRRGSNHDDSGFNVSLPDAESWVAALTSVREFLESERELFDDLRSFGVRAILDIGVTVGKDRSYAPSIEIPNDVLSNLVALGVGLNVSAYPTSDET